MKDLIQDLIKEAESNQVSNAVFHVFALRKRTRNSIVLTSLYNKMKKEGFDYTRGQYVDFIKTLGNLGLGELHYTNKGKLKGLRNIKITLQSIGAAACKQKTDLKSIKIRNKFTPILTKPVVEPYIAPGLTVKLQVSINDKTVNLSIPKDLSTEDLSLLIDKLRA